MLSELSRYYLLNGVPWLIPGNIYLDTVTQNIYPLLGVSGASILIYLISSNLVIFYKQTRIFYIIIFLLVVSIVPSHKIENISELNINKMSLSGMTNLNTKAAKIIYEKIIDL